MWPILWLRSFFWVVFTILKPSWGFYLRFQALEGIAKALQQASLSPILEACVNDVLFKSIKRSLPSGFMNMYFSEDSSLK